MRLNRQRLSHRVRLAPAALLLACALAAFVAGCDSAPAPANSGVQGEVRIGPVSPVEQQGVPNDKPYVATFRIEQASDGKVAAEATSAADGSFKVALAPGRYVLEPVNGTPVPIAQPQEFTVSAGGFTTVRVDYDSGIR